MLYDEIGERRNREKYNVSISLFEMKPDYNWIIVNRVDTIIKENFLRTDH
jgi:hypothetical protein